MLTLVVGAGGEHGRGRRMLQLSLQRVDAHVGVLNALLQLQLHLALVGGHRGTLLLAVQLLQIGGAMSASLL